MKATAYLVSTRDGYWDVFRFRDVAMRKAAHVPGARVTPLYTRQAVSDYLRELGAKGGKVRGEAKKRGDSDYYRALVAKRWKRDSVT
jgi:hypothetical protein